MENSGEKHNRDSGGSPPPEYRGHDYHKLTQDDHLMAPQPGAYDPAPAAFRPPPPPQHTSFSNNSSNVVVVGQPSAAQTETVIVQERPNDHLVFVLVLMVLCCLTGNLFAFLCLVPALILSISSGNASNSGNYDAARGYAKATCVCSLCSVTIYLIAIVIGVIFTALVFTVGIGIKQV
jgi:hypothetical protein